MFYHSHYKLCRATAIKCQTQLSAGVRHLQTALTDTAILNGQISTRADSLIYTHRFADLATQFVSDALPLVDVDADALAEDEFHCCRMTQLHYHLHYQIHPLIVWSHSVEMNRVMD